ncbi:hypothetical protein [Dokdonia sp.]|uniref:hypothetical protein n=1 Tax=Dokdonia sp. TaxID=2024995 RepID=UPI003265B504
MMYAFRFREPACRQAGAYKETFLVISTIGEITHLAHCYKRAKNNDPNYLKVNSS